MLEQTQKETRKAVTPEETATIKRSSLYKIQEAYWALCALKTILYATDNSDSIIDNFGVNAGALVGVIVDRLEPIIDEI